MLISKPRVTHDHQKVVELSSTFSHQIDIYLKKISSPSPHLNRNVSSSSNTNIANSPRHEKTKKTKTTIPRQHKHVRFVPSIPKSKHNCLELPSPQQRKFRC